MLHKDERRHEEGKLEFRDAEDDAALVGRGEGSMLKRERRRKPTVEKGERRRVGRSSIQGIFTAIFSTTYPQIHCLKL